MPKSDPTPEAELPANYIRVRVRAKGNNKISRGDRAEHQHKDNFFVTGDIVALHIDNAKALLELDYVDEAN